MTSRPSLSIDVFREQDVVDRVLQTLSAVESLNLYVRAGNLVHVVNDPVLRRDENATESSAPRVRLADARYVRMLIAQHIRLTGYDGRAKKVVERRVPSWLIDGLMSLGEWPSLRSLAGVVSSPMLRPDGTVVDAPGYDSITRLVVRPDAEYPEVPTVPTREDAQRALEVLLDPFTDFPFAGPEHRYAVLAAILTFLARYSFSGPTPLVAVNKNVRGSGGSMLVDAIVAIGCGGAPARMSYTTSEEERRKRVLAVALAGERAVSIDNVTANVGGAALEMALTAPRITDRILGRSEQVVVDTDTVWLVNGNGLTFTSDALRRTLFVELESLDERPELRTGFRYPRLIEHLRNRRPQLVVAGLTILRAWHVDGRPSQGLPPWGSFEGWSFIRDVIVWAGGIDPTQGRESAQVSLDTEVAALRTIFESWSCVAGPSGNITARELIARAWDSDDDTVMAIREALLELCPTRTGRPDPGAIGRALGKRKGRVVDGMRLVASKPTNAGIIWSVEPK